jgi:hypothetical protein
MKKMNTNTTTREKENLATVQSEVVPSYEGAASDSDTSRWNLRLPRRSTLATSPVTAAVTASAETQPKVNKLNEGSGGIHLKKPPTVKIKDFRAQAERKVVGLKNYGLDRRTTLKRRQPISALDASSVGAHSTSPGAQNRGLSVEEMEEKARKKTIKNPFRLMFLGNVAALRVVAYYLITLETVLTCCLTTGLTMYWYTEYKDDETWNGGNLDFILLTFAVISPISAAIGMAFARRERALVTIASFRSFSYHLYLAHSLWDWNDSGGRAAVTDVDWLEHCDAVLAQLIGIGDELSRFLSLPTTSRSRHRMTRAGRREASRTIEVAYHLVESMTTQRVTRLTLYSERLKKIGLPSGEVSRLRQYERFISDSLEQLRMVKMYRTPQALRSLARLFTVLLPPYYAPAFAQVAIDTHSLGVGLVNAVIVALALTGLFLSLEVLEDPFTAFLALDGIDVREEFEVLHFVQLMHTRDLVFPSAPPYPSGRRAALRPEKKKMLGDTAGAPSFIGKPPVQEHHHERRYGSQIPSIIGTEDVEPETKALSNTSVWDDEELSILIDADNQYADAELGYAMDDDADHARRESQFLDRQRDDVRSGHSFGSIRFGRQQSSLH